jgi:type I restriction enzyme S subunit
MRLSVNKKYLIPRFLYYFFLSHIGQKELLKNASQVGVPAIANPTKSLKDVNVLVPPISEQSRIVSILSSLDDKIELNLMMNKTLETIAQAIFKEWFEGPKISKLTDYVDLNPKESIKKGAIVKYIEMANLPLEGFSIKSFIHRLFSAGSKFQNYDTLLARITPCLENGKTGFVDFLNPREVGFGSTEFIVMRPKVRVSPYYVYLLSRDQGFRQFAIKSMVGTSGRQRVQTDMLYSFPIAKIELGLMEKFDKLINPFFQKIKSNSDNNTALSQIRDTLLPKLMTGKIRMK